MLCSFLQATYNHSLSVCVPLGTQQTRIYSALLLLACCGAVGSHFAAVCLSFPHTVSCSGFLGLCLCLTPL